MSGYRARLAAYLTAFSILLPLVVLYGYGQEAREHGLYLFHACLLGGIAAVYWFHGFMYFLKCKVANPALTLQEALQNLFYPLTLLVVVSVLFAGFFIIADEVHKVRTSAMVGGLSLFFTTRFAISVIEVFPDTPFPLGAAAHRAKSAARSRELAPVRQPAADLPSC